MKKVVKIFLQIILLYIIPVMIILIGIYGINRLNKRIEKVNLNIKEELHNKTLTGLKKEFGLLKNEYSNYALDDDDYNKKMIVLKKEIEDLEKEKAQKNDDIKSKQDYLENLKKQNNSKNEEYKKISSHKINGVITYNQYPSYPTGCEAISLYILLRYYNVNVSAADVIDYMPKGKKPYREGGVVYGGNPNYEFLGDPRSYSGWGIYDKGLATTASKFKKGIINGTGKSFNQLYKILRENRPVIVWTSINLSNPSLGLSWYTDANEKITWKNNNHAVVVIGYNENNIIISDPIDGRIKYMNKNKFISVYNYMGRRAIYY